MLAGIAVPLLQQAGEHVEFAGCPIQVIVGEFAPPSLGLASDLFPLTFENVFVHTLILLWIL
jgi:hypothetical protein